MTRKQLDLQTDPERLGEPEAEALIEALRAQVRRHDYLYHAEARPEISDEEYDRLFRRLKQVETSFPHLITPDSPTQRVGAEPQDKFETVRHAAPMLSLDSTQDEAEARRFDERVRKGVDGTVRYLLEPKLDGASIELVYENGLLARAVTRGNGREGEGVTENVKTMPSVPLRLREEERAAPPFLAVRGEVMMSISAFERLNQKLVERGEEPYASPRNSAAGAIRQLDPRVTAERELHCLAYDVLALRGDRFHRDQDMVQALRAWGFRVPEGIEVADSFEGVRAYHQSWGDRRDSLDYEIDGVVVKLDDIEARADLGMTSHHPRWALAYKFEPRKEITRVEKIVVSVGRTGVLTPVALLLPVVVGGVTISRASLHNREEVLRKDVREGDRVRIQRAGDVIPQVVERIDEPEHEQRKRFRMPKRCPACDTPVVEKGPFTRCPNHLACPAQLVGRICHFGSRGAMDVEGLGEETAKLLVERGLVSELAELFDLTDEKLIGLPGFAEKNANRLVSGIQARKKPELARFLHALGIPEVGGTVSRDLALHFRSLDRLLEADQETLQTVPGIGPKMSEVIVEFLSEPHNRKAIEHVIERGVKPVAPQAPAQTPLAGKKFVFTGGMERLSRAQAKKVVEDHGGKVVGSVSKETDYVVAGADPGSKYDKAVELGVTVLTEEQFVELLEEAGLEVGE